MAHPDLGVVFGHVGLGVIENGLSVFQPELRPDVIRRRVPQLVRNPARDFEPFTSAGDRTAVGVSSDFKHRLRRIGQQVLREDQLSLRADGQCPRLSVMNVLVIDQLREPDRPGAVDHARRETQQFTRPSTDQPLKFDQVFHERRDDFLDGPDIAVCNGGARGVVVSLGATGQKRGDGLQLLERCRFDQFTLDTSLEDVTNPTDGPVDRIPNPALFDERSPDGLQRERPEVVNGGGAVQFDERSDCQLEAMDLGRWLPALQVVACREPHESEAEFVDGKLGGLNRGTFSTIRGEGIKRDSARMLSDQLAKADAGVF